MRQEFLKNLRSETGWTPIKWFFNLFFKILLTNVDKNNLSKIRNERDGFRTLNVFAKSSISEL